MTTMQRVNNFNNFQQSPLSRKCVSRDRFGDLLTADRIKNFVGYPRPVVRERIEGVGVFTPVRSIGQLPATGSRKMTLDRPRQIAV